MKAPPRRPAKRSALSQPELRALLQIGREPSAAQLAERLGVSLPTVRRLVAALRRKGYQIESRRRSDGWHYAEAPLPPLTPEQLKNDPLLKVVGLIKGPLKKWMGKEEDREIYDWD